MEVIRLCEKRLLTVVEFMKYSSMGRNRAVELGKRENLCMKLGNKLYFDRIKFDNWVEEQME